MSAAKKAKQKDEIDSPVQLLVASALEAWCHQLLYVRNVYPKASFCNSYFLGIRSKANRHPVVVDYIEKAVKVAVPALVSLNRVADEFCLEVIDDCSDSEDENEAEVDNADPDAPIDFQKELAAEREKDDNSQEPTQDNNDDDNGDDGLARRLFLSSESTPTSSQEEPLKKRARYSATPNDTDDEDNDNLDSGRLSQSSNSEMESSPLVEPQNQLSQQTLSSMSSSQPIGGDQGNKLSQDSYQQYEAEEEPNDDESNEDKHPYCNASVSPNNSLHSRYLLVLEKFSLYFSAPLEERKETMPHRSSFQRNQTGRAQAKAKAQRQKEAAALERREEALLNELENGFRNLILNLSSLKRDRVPPSKNLTFKLLLHMNDRQTVCPSIERAFETGSWYPCSNETNVLVADKRPRMPLYQVVVDKCSLSFHMQRQPRRDADSNNIQILAQLEGDYR